MNLRILEMSSLFLILFLSNAVSSLSNLEKVMKEMAMLTDKMGGDRETEDYHMNPTHVMDLMLGFEDKRLLKESQAYIKEFRNGDHGEYQPDILSRRKRSLDPSKLYETFNIGGVDDALIHSAVVTQADLEAMSDIVGVVDQSGSKVQPCWVLGSTVQVMEDWNILHAGTALPDSGLPAIVISGRTTNVITNSAESLLFVFQTLHGTCSGESCRMHVVYEAALATSMNPVLGVTRKAYVLNSKTTSPDSVRSSLLVSENGIYFASVNSDGLDLYYYKYSDASLSLVTSSSNQQSSLGKYDVARGISDVVLFTKTGEAVNYLAIARTDKCFLYEFDDGGVGTVLSLNQRFKRSADVVNFFTNSLGDYLVFKDSTGVGSTYILASGEFVLMQDNQLEVWGVGDMTNYVRPRKYGYMLPDQEFIFVADKMKFLKFRSPGVLVVEKVLDMKPPNGYETIVALPVANSQTIGNKQVVVFKSTDKDGNLLLQMNGLSIDSGDAVPYTNLGELSTALLQVEENVQGDEATLQILKGTLPLIKLNEVTTNPVLVLTAQDLTISGTTDANNIAVTVQHSTQSLPTFDTIDYNNPTSDLATAVTKSTTDTQAADFLYLNSILKTGLQTVAVKTGFSITAPSVTTYKAQVGKLDSPLVTGKSSSSDLDMNAFITDSLKTNGPQSIRGDITADKVIVSDETVFKETATTLASAIEPVKFIDTEQVNVLAGSFQFKNVVFKEAPVFETTVNNIALKDIITTKNSAESTLTLPIAISGEKTFSSGLTAESSIQIDGKINSRKAASVLKPILLYTDTAEQTFTVNSFFFNDIKVKSGLVLPTFGSGKHDVQKAILADIVMTNVVKGDITGSNTYNALEIADLTSSTINGKNPEDFLVDGKAQHIESPLDVSKLVTADLTVTNLNYVDLTTDVARTDQVNEFTAPITFNDIVIGKSADMINLKTIGGVDVSTLAVPSQEYSGQITVTDSLVIHKDDITVKTVDVGATYIAMSVDKSTFDSAFLFKDTEQELLHTHIDVPQSNFAGLTLHKSLDGLNLETDIVHTSGAEDIKYDGIVFQSETTFKADLIIKKSEAMSDEPKIGNVNIKDLQKQIYCPDEDDPVSRDGVRRFNGVKTLAAQSTYSEVTSYFDVTSDKFIADGRNFEGFDSGIDVAELQGANDYNGKMTFSHPSDKTEIDVSQGLELLEDNFDITASDESIVQLNGQNLLGFEKSIVKNTAKTFEVTSGVEFSHLTASNGKLVYGGIIDGIDPVAYLNERVLLDGDDDINVELTSPTIVFDEGVTIEPAGSTTYFDGLDLVAYQNSLFAAGFTRPPLFPLGTGEEVCEGHGYSDAECSAIGCCEWDDNSCWSSVGPESCETGRARVCEGHGYNDAECNFIGCCHWDSRDNSCWFSGGADCEKGGWWVGGQKTFATGKKLAVEGKLSFLTNVHPFDVNLPDLHATALTRSADQTVELDYIIKTISSVDKIHAEKIDGVRVDDICLTDGVCAIACSQDPCATFEKTVTSDGGVNIGGNLEGIDMASVKGSLTRNNNQYSLDSLEVPNGDFSWTNDVQGTNTVSDLYSNLVVKSDKIRVAQSAPQDITGKVEFAGTVTFSDVTLVNKVVYVGSSEVEPEAIIADAASKAGTNTFSTSKTFKADLEAKTPIMQKLKSTTEINGVALADYRTNALVVDDETSTGSSSFVQTVSEDWTLSNGVKVTNKLSVAGAVDGVEVEDFVRKNIFNTREIPSVTLAQGAEVDGDIITTGTSFQSKMDNFFTDAINTGDTSTISRNLEFTGKVTITGPVTVGKLNDIPASTWVETGLSKLTECVEDCSRRTCGVDLDIKVGCAQMFNCAQACKMRDLGLSRNECSNQCQREVASIGCSPSVRGWEFELCGPCNRKGCSIYPSADECETGCHLYNQQQVITAGKVFSKLVTVEGNLVSDDIAGTDLSDKFADAMKIDEDALITGPSVTFSAETTLTSENLRAPLEEVFDTLMEDFVTQISLFVDKLYAYYTKNIIEVLPSFLKEVEVAKQLDLGKLSYLEEQNVPEYLDMENESDDVIAVTSVEMDGSLFSHNFIFNSTQCGLNDPCACQESKLASSLDQSGIKSQTRDRTFTFSLARGVFTVSSKVDSYSDNCIISETKGLVVSGILTNIPITDLDLLSSATVGFSLKPQDLNDLQEVGFVTDVVMWEQGDSVSMAVAVTYPSPYVHLYSLKYSDANPTWVRNRGIGSSYLERPDSVHSLKVVKFNTGVHLFVARDVAEKFWGQTLNDVLVFGMKQDNVFEYIQTIAAPGLASMEVLLSREEVLFMAATNLKLSYGADSAAVSTFTFDITDSTYKEALLPENVKVVDGSLIKILTAQIARHSVVFLAEVNKLNIYRYMPYQGLKLIGSLSAKKILDFSVYRQGGSKGEQIMVYVLMEGPTTKIPTTKIYALTMSGTVPSVKLSFNSTMHT